MEQKSGISEVAALIKCLHVTDKFSEDDVKKQKSYCSRENLDLKEDEKLPNKSLNFEEDIQDNIVKSLENLKLCAKHDDRDISERDETKRDECNDALRKRGPDKVTAQAPHSYTPYASYNYSQGSSRTWVPKPRQPTNPAYHRPHTPLLSCWGKGDVQEIYKIKKYLEDVEVANDNGLGDLVTRNMSYNNTKERSALLGDEIFEGILDMESLTGTPPIYIPDAGLCPEASQDFSPKSTASVESGYTSASPDSTSPPSPENRVCTSVVFPVPELGYSVYSLPEYSNTVHLKEKTVPNFFPAKCAPNPKRKKKKEKDKFFVGVDGKARDCCRRDINLKKNQGGLDQKDDQGRTILHVAIESEREVYAITFISTIQKSFQSDSRKKGLEHYASLTSFLDQTDTWGYTPLLLACAKNMGKVVDYLLECGASVNVKGHGSVLHYLAERGGRLLEVTKVLCASPRTKEFIGTLNDRKQTALHVACCSHNKVHLDKLTNINEVVDNQETVCLLLQKGADLCAQDDLGQTPLHKAMINNNSVLLGKLHASTSMMDWSKAVNLKDAEGMTVLHRAVACQGLDAQAHTDLLRRLIAMNASPRIPDKRGMLPKDYVPIGREDLLKALDIGYFQRHLMTN